MPKRQAAPKGPTELRNVRVGDPTWGDGLLICAELREGGTQITNSDVMREALERFVAEHQDVLRRAKRKAAKQAKSA